MKGKFLRACNRKWQKMGSRVIPAAAVCEDCCQWTWWKNPIPRDMPKGQLVVYVGEDRMRFVIKVSVLKHQLFKALLDQAREEHDFDADSKLCIPCGEEIFSSVIQCASSVSKDLFASKGLILKALD